ncbi:helix-turn-helix transcriptional regulator [Thermosynechococcus sp. PP45]|uniref:helix-turn-helix domain-containing protein n=1 Tax=unclassified Thermosynechococcus TaxID=2622553 RepID=UPI0026722ADF|nr:MULTISPECIES: helix-turn-helix transcriptional regulator [unclassified Thermosynechococcus]WKT82526.1 helix-turn-helix transcriptional regulator [Thermosynechococcus sp. PP45]WNC26140.1 helix-turn-helix transcriptional regulator [Thermosynechococcus sp. PP551]WNC28715.1 helix-turn-helix transcriptional regulator [Thermosynechococcus sp. PP555]
MSLTCKVIERRSALSKGLFRFRMVSPLSRKQLSRLLRQKRGIRSQRAFAAELGISYTCLQKWENMASFPNAENLLKLCRVFGFEDLESFIAYLNQTDVTNREEEQLVTEILGKLRHLPLATAVRVLETALGLLKAAANNEGDI